MSVETSKLDAIHEELIMMDERLASIGDLEVIVRDLPGVKLTEKEKHEVRISIGEMRCGKRVTLEELRCA